MQQIAAADTHTPDITRAHTPPIQGAATIRCPHPERHFVVASALDPMRHHAVNLSRLHHRIEVPATELAESSGDRSWVSVHGPSLPGWADLFDVDPGQPSGSDRTAPSSPLTPQMRWRAILPQDFILLRVRFLAGSGARERVVGVHRRDLVPVRIQPVAIEHGLGIGVRARLRTACRLGARIIIDLLDGTRLVGRAQPPLAGDLVFLSPRPGCSPIAVRAAHITDVTLVPDPGNT